MGCHTLPRSTSVVSTRLLLVSRRGENAQCLAALSPLRNLTILRVETPRPSPSVYPEMRTILRAYHSVPSLQNTVATRKSMQGESVISPTTGCILPHVPSDSPLALDAPRMKNGLKAVKLVQEAAEIPSSLQDVERLKVRGVFRRERSVAESLSPPRFPARQTGRRSDPADDHLQSPVRHCHPTGR
jgi:hypothetical protein